MYVKNIFIALMALSMAASSIASESSLPMLETIDNKAYCLCSNNFGILFSDTGHPLYSSPGRGAFFLRDGDGNYTSITNEAADACTSRLAQAPVFHPQNSQNKAGFRTESPQEASRSATLSPRAAYQSSPSSSLTSPQGSGQVQQTHPKSPTQSFDPSSSTNSASTAVGSNGNRDKAFTIFTNTQGNNVINSQGEYVYVNSHNPYEYAVSNGNGSFRTIDKSLVASAKRSFSTSHQTSEEYRQVAPATEQSFVSSPKNPYFTKATYNPIITCIAAPIGVVAAQLAEKKFGTTKKKAFFAGAAATSVTSVGCQYAQHLSQQNNLDYTTVLTQWATDTGLYCLSQYLIRYFSSTKATPAKNESPELLKHAANSQNAQATQSPVRAVPAAAFNVPPLWKRTGNAAQQ